ncbi:MAG: hypothetical protein K9N49_04740 [Candidatus Marinimicrobia bacterium]|nr:hypothetical protein [Candidatus Neomarinimicrobiota bacterium]
MKKDPIVEEIHKLRTEHARRFNYDLDAMFEDLRRKQARRKNVADLKPVKPVVLCVAEPQTTYGTTGTRRMSKASR